MNDSDDFLKRRERAIALGQTFLRASDHGGLRWHPDSWEVTQLHEALEAEAKLVREG